MKIDKKKIGKLNDAERVQVALDVLEENYNLLKKENIGWADQLCPGLDWLETSLNILKRQYN